jgi:hypothetical protein
MRDTSKIHSHNNWAMLAVAALFVAMTVAAIGAGSRPRAVPAELWKQTPNFVLSLPGGYGVEEALY